MGIAEPLSAGAGRYCRVVSSGSVLRVEGAALSPLPCLLLSRSLVFSFKDLGLTQPTQGYRPSWVSLGTASFLIHSVPGSLPPTQSPAHPLSRVPGREPGKAGAVGRFSCSAPLASLGFSALGPVEAFFFGGLSCCSPSPSLSLLRSKVKFDRWYTS